VRKFAWVASSKIPSSLVGGTGGVKTWGVQKRRPEIDWWSEFFGGRGERKELLKSYNKEKN